MIGYKLSESSILDRIKRLWPPYYRRRRDAEMREAIRWLVDNPDAPVMVGEHFIPNGYGASGRPLGF